MVPFHPKTAYTDSVFLPPPHDTIISALLPSTSIREPRNQTPPKIINFYPSIPSSLAYFLLGRGRREQVYDLNMYPKVKVGGEPRDGDHGDEDHGQRSPLMGLKAIDFLSIFDYDSRPGQEHQVFPERKARVQSCGVGNVAPPTNSASEGKMDTSLEDDTKQNVRASPVPRPRAVLSSPNNDVMIGKKNRKQTEKTLALRKCNVHLQQPGNLHPKTAAKDSGYRSPKNVKVPSETADENSAHTQKGVKQSASSEASQKTRPRVKKENFFRV